jgi:hypothetical protein
MNFKLIGGGAGSGRYFNTSSEQVIYAGGPTSGEDSVLWFLGDRTAAIEPVPLLVAGGGLAGTNSYGNIGRSNSGNGGVCQRFRGGNIQVSQITNINLTTDLVTGDTSTQGTPGVIGDTSNTAVNVSGVGGWKLDASGDGYHQTYGRGCRGTSRAGMGGSGENSVRTAGKTTTGKGPMQISPTGGRSSRGVSYRDCKVFILEIL